MRKLIWAAAIVGLAVFGVVAGVDPEPSADPTHGPPGAESDNGSVSNNWSY